MDNEKRERLRNIDPWILRQLITREKIWRVAQERGISFLEASLYLYEHPDEYWWEKKEGEEP